MEIDIQYRFLPGVYKIINTITNKPYIGSTVDLYERLSWQHLRELRLGIHINNHLQNSWKCYGEEVFIYEIVEIVDFIEDEIELNNFLLELEQYYLDTELFAQEYIRGEDKRFLEYGYNLTPTAGKTIGWKVNEEQIERNRTTMIECWKDPEYRRKREEYYKNREPISKPHSEETKEKIRQKAILKYSDPIRKAELTAYQQTGEYKQKISVKSKANWQKPEYVEKLKNSPFFTGRKERTLKNWQNPEYNEKRLKTWNETKSNPNYLNPNSQPVELIHTVTKESLKFKDVKSCKDWILEKFGNKPQLIDYCNGKKLFKGYEVIYHPKPNSL